MGEGKPMTGFWELRQELAGSQSQERVEDGERREAWRELGGDDVWVKTFLFLWERLVTSGEVGGGGTPD